MTKEIDGISCPDLEMAHLRRAVEAVGTVTKARKRDFTKTLTLGPDEWAAESAMRKDNKLLARNWMRLNSKKRSSLGFSLSSMLPGRGARWNEHLPVSYDYLDHAEFFTGPGGREKAIVAHLYGDDAVQRAAKFAQQHGLGLHIPPIAKSSWYSPGHATLVCYATPGSTISWLSEQSDEH